MLGFADSRLRERAGARLHAAGNGPKPRAEQWDLHTRRHALTTHFPAHWRYVEAVLTSPPQKVDRQVI